MAYQVAWKRGRGTQRGARALFKQHRLTQRIKIMATNAVCTCMQAVVQQKTLEGWRTQEPSSFGAVGPTSGDGTATSPDPGMC